MLVETYGKAALSERSCCDPYEKEVLISIRSNTYQYFIFIRGVVSKV